MWIHKCIKFQRAWLSLENLGHFLCHRPPPSDNEPTIGRPTHRVATRTFVHISTRIFTHKISDWNRSNAFWLFDLPHVQWTSVGRTQHKVGHEDNSTQRFRMRPLKYFPTVGVALCFEGMWSACFIGLKAVMHVPFNSDPRMFRFIPPLRNPSLDPTLMIYQKQSDMASSSSARENETRVDAADNRRFRWNIWYHSTGERASTLEFVYLKLSVYGNARPWALECTVGVELPIAAVFRFSISNTEDPAIAAHEITWPSPYPFQDTLLECVITLRSFNVWQRHEKRDIEGFHGIKPPSPQTPNLAVFKICQNLLDRVQSV